MEHMSAANGVAVDHSYHRLWHTTYLALNFQNIQARNAILIHISALALNRLVAAGAESLVAGAGENYYINPLIFAANIQRIAHFIHRCRAEGISIALSVDGNFSDSFKIIEENVFIFPDGFPVSCAFHLAVIVN